MLFLDLGVSEETKGREETGLWQTVPIYPFCLARA
jgi:hypothetical protein